MVKKSTKASSKENGDINVEYEVEKILDKRNFKGSIQYKIKWEGFGVSDATWENEENVTNCQDLIEKFNREHMEESAPSKKRANESDTDSNESRKKRSSPGTPQSRSKTKRDIEDPPNVDGVGYEYKDKIEDILGCKKYGDKLFFYVKWIEKDTLSWVDNTILRVKDPQLLLDFYEERIQFGGK
ncbi:chromo domain-containing protein [Tieghemostelium lacteum]|uniref:Chromo domain-containing protein n=1 Tax=Tieghemostelium lacteum TaxID=361077 RepID=A0A152A455_TIELA|nr:chromo domain-containing protein [Tieghemostelium lacteum]|eukprot:KYR00841.1 chromo domain-containing protein [Tieghemostelium lacteum]